MTSRAETLRSVTDLVDYLIVLGIAFAFRDAHEFVARALSHAITARCGIRRARGSGAASGAGSLAPQETQHSRLRRWLPYDPATMRLAGMASSRKAA